jgi:D-alanine-D-alanine ligase
MLTASFLLMINTFSMNSKKTVAILCGGRSAEHEVSLQSGKSIIDAIDREKYDLMIIGIDKQGQWLIYPQDDYLKNENDPAKISLSNAGKPIAIVPGTGDNKLYDIYGSNYLTAPDVVFPILHGPFGEDGTMQGLLKLLDLPFVGPSVLGSAVSMDKDIMKKLMDFADIQNAEFYTFVNRAQSNPSFETVEKALGMPVFIKPANMGSSVGVSKANSKEEFEKYLALAYQFDHKVIVEKYIKGREIECAVLGNEKPKASIPGEIVAHHEFYSYDAKYIDEKGASLLIPAKMEEQTIKKVQAIAVKTFQALNCEGLGRVDMFITENDNIFVNEINTLPGFTKISMYPKLWAETGIAYKDLISELIDLAIDRHGKDKALKTDMTF